MVPSHRLQYGVSKERDFNLAIECKGAFEPAAAAAAVAAAEAAAEAAMCDRVNSISTKYQYHI